MPPVAGIGVGNMFSFWLWAHHGRLVGENRWVRRTDAMAPWLEAFPGLRPLVIDAAAVKLRDRRDADWHQDFDRFPRAHLESFIRERLFAGTRMALRDSDPGTVAVNVRRGDYYSDPALRKLYGFDIAGYVRTAMEGSLSQAQVDAVEVVSDDPEWCRIHLSFLSDYGRIHYQSASDGPVENLGQLASARRLVLANSSFSYWAGYMSNVRHQDNYELVWAPSFHRRDINGGRSWHLDPRWSVVENVFGDARDDVSRWCP